jgi:hypothetical protein
MRAGNYLAVLCLLFGAVFAVSVSGSLAQRIGNFFSVGLIPAIGFYAGGHVLGHLLVFGVKLLDVIMARCSRYVVHLAIPLLNWAGARISHCLNGSARSKLKARGRNGDEFRT